MIKKFYLLIILAFCQYCSFSQNWVNAYQIGTGNTGPGGYLGGPKMAVDGFDNIIHSTAYAGTLTIGATTFTGTSQEYNSILIKRDNQDNILWMQHLKCGGDVRVEGIYTDNSSNIYVMGTFGYIGATPTTLNCNPFPLSNPSGGYCTFILKYSPAGAVLWSRAIKTFTGQPGNDFYGIDGNGTNKISILSSIVGVPSATIGTSVISPSVGSPFHAQIDNNGNWLFANNFGGGYTMRGASISMAANNDIFISAVFNSSISCGSTGTYVATGSYPSEMICKIDNTGSFAWSKLTSNLSYYSNKVITVNNDAYLLGTYGGTLNLGSTTITTTSTATYFSKIDNSGNWLWLKKYGELTTRFFDAHKTNTNIYLTGYTKPANTNTLDAVVLTYTNTMITSSSNDPCFVVKADLNGNAIKGAVGQMGGFSSQSISDMTYAGGKLYLTGVLGNTVQCGGYQVIKPSTGGYKFVVVYSDSADQITGNTYYDMNSNAVYDAGDLNYSGILKLKGVSSSNAYSNGSYKIEVSPGTYTTEIASPPLYFTQTPMSYVSTFTSFGKSDTANHFYFQPIPNQNDLNIFLTAWPFRPGFTGNAHAQLKNAGTTVKSGTFSVVFNPSVSVVSCTPAALSITSNTVIFSYSNIPVFGSSLYSVTYSLSATAVNGAKVKCYASVVDPLDLTPLDNTDTIEPPVTTSYDPNMKEVYPLGMITPSYISSGQPLDYIIHFQNTGSDTAFTVVVKDTISPLLDLNSFQLVASSHSVSVSMTGRVMSFNFYNILLPDSNVNEPKSHGFVSYKIKPNSTLVVGDSIKNTAYIYFDFNSAIVTNTTKTPVGLLSGINEMVNEAEFSLYPNPASSQVNLISRSESISTVKLYSVDGRLLYSDNVKARSAAIHVSGLPAGLYLVNFKIGDKTFTRKLIID